MRGSVPRIGGSERKRPPRLRTDSSRAREVVVTLTDNIAGGFYWSARHRTIVLDATLDEANMLVALARGLRLIVDR